jgi:hypothetical protein
MLLPQMTQYLNNTRLSNTPDLDIEQCNNILPTDSDNVAGEEIVRNLDDCKYDMYR